MECFPTELPTDLRDEFVSVWSSITWPIICCTQTAILQHFTKIKEKKSLCRAHLKLRLVRHGACRSVQSLAAWDLTPCPLCP